jgi:DNA-binding response OmpR family regulator
MSRVLVVDDDPDVIRVVEKVLRMGGHDVFTAFDAMKAMDLLNSSLYDMLITDANMPRFSGFELVTTIKNNKKFSRMAIAMLTGLREKKDIEKAIRAGVDDYIIKPIDPMLLVQKVESLFEKKPPMERAEYAIPENSTLGKATVACPSRIVRVTELGLVLRSAVEVPEGLPIEIGTEIFKKMEMRQAPALKVISCRKLAEFEYEIRVSFVGASEGFYQRVRAWIYAQSTQKQRRVG